jgi:predicted phage-related endonuclease
MKIYKNIIQGSEEWLELRHGKIGGSTAGKLMTKLDKSVRECASYYSILGDRMEDFDPFKSEFKSFDMIRGNDLEPIARQEYERIYGVEVEQIGWIEIEGTNTGISVDGYIPSKNKAIEIKCPSAATHANYIINTSEIITDYVWQIVHYFAVIDGLESVDCISYRPENKLSPLMVVTVTKETTVKISAKIALSVAELIEISTKRIEELENEIKKDIESLTEKTEF